MKQNLKDIFTGGEFLTAISVHFRAKHKQKFLTLNSYQKQNMTSQKPLF